MALSDMLMYWAIGIAVIQAAYCQENFIKVKCDPENQGVYSQDAVLNCKVVSIKKDIQIMKMMWCKVEADICVGKTMLTFEDGKWSAEDARFSSGALEWNEKELNVSLLVQKTQVSDQGSYRFMISTDTGYDKGNTYLRVTAPYSVPVISSLPGINIEDSMPVTLTCNASGGYPPGQIHWFDQLDSNWTKSSALRTIPTQDGRFNLSSVFTTTASSSMALYKCVVVNDKMDKQRAEYQLAIGPGKQEGTKNTTAITAVFIVVGALASGILILYIHRRRSRGNTWIQAQQEEKEEHEKTMEEGEATG
ncbi:CD276 antigen-like isoform X2 [Acipenser oxyrinchus oxyrinchus]|uniref:CD276 antigen-like isoform X2 n=1 Tax=Acipenser oxyrinchus oxyrinchus TaxID=40147 RepID=A0AAD8G051_ACIOX|nr:CD276 antigen-like isoform X2 [Acipenser oxyrinchus oxyrinchus]